MNIVVVVLGKLKKHNVLMWMDLQQDTQMLPFNILVCKFAINSELFDF